jgi:hypothetical protein
MAAGIGRKGFRAATRTSGWEPPNSLWQSRILGEPLMKVIFVGPSLPDADAFADDTMVIRPPACQVSVPQQYSPLVGSSAISVQLSESC